MGNKIASPFPSYETATAHLNEIEIVHLREIFKSMSRNRDMVTLQNFVEVGRARNAAIGDEWYRCVEWHTWPLPETFHPGYFWAMVCHPAMYHSAPSPQGEAAQSWQNFPLRAPAFVPSEAAQPWQNFPLLAPAFVPSVHRSLLPTHFYRRTHTQCTYPSHPYPPHPNTKRNVPARQVLAACQEARTAAALCCHGHEARRHPRL